MDTNSAALKAACVILAEKNGCPSDGHACNAIDSGCCDLPCWECWQENLLLVGAAYTEVRMHNHPEEFVAEHRAIGPYGQHDTNDLMDAAEALWKAEYKFRLRESVKEALRKRNLKRATEPIIRKCQKAVLKSMPDINETVQAKYREYRDEDPALDDYEIVDQLEEDVFANK